MATSRNDVCKILATSGLILLDAMVMHEVLARKYSDIRTLSAVRNSNNIKSVFKDEWRKILDKNYEPIFSI